MSEKQVIPTADFEWDLTFFGGDMVDPKLFVKKSVAGYTIQNLQGQVAWEGTWWEDSNIHERKSWKTCRVEPIIFAQPQCAQGWIHCGCPVIFQALARQAVPHKVARPFASFFLTICAVFSWSLFWNVTDYLTIRHFIWQ